VTNAVRDLFSSPRHEGPSEEAIRAQEQLELQRRLEAERRWREEQERLRREAEERERVRRIGLARDLRAEMDARDADISGTLGGVFDDKNTAFFGSGGSKVVDLSDGGDALLDSDPNVVDLRDELVGQTPELDGERLLEARARATAGSTIVVSDAATQILTGAGVTRGTADLALTLHPADPSAKAILLDARDGLVQRGASTADRIFHDYLKSAEPGLGYADRAYTTSEDTARGVTDPRFWSELLERLSCFDDAGAIALYDSWHANAFRQAREDLAGDELKGALGETRDDLAELEEAWQAARQLFVVVGPRDAGPRRNLPLREAKHP
jgi:hypothetical protein